jgi:thiol:disulfide interchange protein DsbD
LRKLVKKYSGDWPKTISGVLVNQWDSSREGIEVNLVISEKPESRTGVAPVSNFSERKSGQNMETGATPVLPSQPLWQMLLYAFIGGLILNIMPCVLPVIALKILGFVGESRSDPRHVRKLGLVYALGVLVSSSALKPLDTGPAGACSSAARFLWSASPRWSCLWH